MEEPRKNGVLYEWKDASFDLDECPDLAFGELEALAQQRKPKQSGSRLATPLWIPGP